MTEKQLNTILTALCDDHVNIPAESRPNIEIMHGPTNGYTVIDAVSPAWEIADGILTARTNCGTRFIDINSIHCVGI